MRKRVIGLGNMARGDDAAGRFVARRLLEAAPASVEIVEATGEATALLAAMEDADAVWLIDACRSGAPPGALQRFDVAAGLPAHLGFGLSSHGFGLAEALALARALGALPARCVVHAIEGRCFDPLAPLSPEVAAAVETLSAKLRRELDGSADRGA